MERSIRKAALEAYKERKARPGVFTVRCLADGRQWVGRTPDLATARNGLWFGLRLGSSPYRALQAAWRELGEESFVFEAVEALADDVEPFAQGRVLKERLAHWRTELGANLL